MEISAGGAKWKSEETQNYKKYPVWSRELNQELAQLDVMQI